MNNHNTNVHNTNCTQADTVEASSKMLRHAVGTGHAVTEEDHESL